MLGAKKAIFLGMVLGAVTSSFCSDRRPSTPLRLAPPVSRGGEGVQSPTPSRQSPKLAPPVSRDGEEGVQSPTPSRQSPKLAPPVSKRDSIVATARRLFEAA